MENMEKAGEEKKDMITYMNDPCKWLQETFRAMLKCLGIDTCSDQPSPPVSSSSSSYSGDNDEDRKCSFQQLPIPADNDPPQLISLRSRPTRPGLGSSGDPQTNDTLS